MRFSPQLLAIALNGFCFIAEGQDSLGEDPSTASPLTSARTALAEYLPDIAVKRLNLLLKEKELTPEGASEARLLLAEALIRSGAPDKVGEALASLPDSPARHYWEAIALAKEGKNSEALEKLSLIPNQATSYWQQATYNRIEIHTILGQSELAFPLIKSLREQSPTYQTKSLALLESQLYLQTSELTNAQNALAALEKSSPQTLLLTGKIQLAANAPAEALLAFEQAIKSDTISLPVRRLALLGQTDALLTQGNAEHALKSLITLLETEPNSDFLQLLHSRFERTLILARTKDAQDSSATLPTEKNLEKFNSILTEFVSPETLGEDANYATPAKELAYYYLARNSEIVNRLTQLTQLLSYNPDPAIAARAEFSIAKILFQQEKNEEAATHLSRIQELQPDSEIAARSADILARLAVKNNDLSEARKLFSQAANHPNLTFSEQALLNQSLLTDRKEKAPLSAIESRITSTEARATFLLEKALAATKAKAPQAREELTYFLREYPLHPRIGEARLAFIELHLNDPKPDFDLITEQFSSLPKNFRKQAPSRQYFEIAHRLGSMTEEWSMAVSSGEAHLQAFPESDSDSQFLLRLAESYYRNGDHSRARYLFTKTAEREKSSTLGDIALLFAARANLAIPTPEATEEALSILQSLSSNGGPLATDARLLQARTLLSQGEAQKALDALAYLPGAPGDQPAAALLAADAYRELSSKNADNYQKAISIYERLLSDSRTSYQRSNQIHFLIARTYRKNGRPELALEPCLRVVDFENLPAGEDIDSEWEYYYQCGFEALDILLEAQRYRAALALARKLAQTKGPGAEQAKVRADQIQLDHLLFAD